MSVLKIEKVLAVPATPSANSMYIVTAAEPDALDIHVSNNTGTGTRKLIAESSLDMQDVEDLLRDIINLPATNLWSWGSNGFGQLGLVLAYGTSSPVQTAVGGAKWSQVSAGGTFTMATKTDGSLWGWGENNVGQLGQNHTTNKSSPVQVTNMNSWETVASGNSHVLAIKMDGTLWTWGLNTYGQLGTNDTTNRSSPAQTIASSSDWRDVAAGLSHSMAIKIDGTLWTWGRNENGQLGSNNRTDRSSPAQTVSAAANWSKISAGNDHSAAVKTDGRLWLWGNNTTGQLGTSNRTRRSSPVQTVSRGTDWLQISISDTLSLAIKIDGSLWAWGKNNSGQLGTGNTISRSSPVQTVSGGTNWSQVTAGADVSFAIKQNGELWAWGNNAYGQLADNTIISKSSPIQITAGDDTWRSVSAGTIHATAINLKSIV